MTGALPPVSVVLAVRNGEPWVRDALESVLGQTHAPAETIVVDGHSEDATREIVGAYPGVRLVEQDGLGIAAARNQAIGLVRSELIAFTSHDDLWAPTKLERQAGRMAERPELGISFTDFRYLHDGTGPLPGGFNPALLERDLKGSIIESMVVRREIFDRVGLFDPTYALAEDVDWLARAKDLGVHIDVLSEVLVTKRVHSDNASSDAERNTPLLFRALKASLERKRAGAGGPGGGVG